MYLLICDETNLEQTKYVQFFVYGGLAVAANAVGPLTHRIGEIRQSRGFRPTDRLKFQNASRPKHIEKADWDAAKAEVIAACREHNARLIACLLLHDIAWRRKDKLIDWQLNTVLQAFSARFLDDAQDVGWVIIDRLGDQREYGAIRERFTLGGEAPGGARRLYPRVIGYAATCDGASHLSSATDVVLGTLGYCVNQRGRTQLPKQLFPMISPLIWRRQWANGPSPVWGYGITLAPMTVNHPPYQEEYRKLREHVAALDAAP